MSRKDHRSSLPSLFLATLLIAPVIPMWAGQAHADVTVRVRGNVKVEAGSRPARVRVIKRHHRRTHRPHVRLRIGGGVHVHGEVYVGGFATPPPPPPPPADCACNPGIPTYYTEPPPPAPMYSPPAPVYAPPVVTAYAPRLPRFGLGVFAGSINVEDRVSGEDLGIFGRLRLTDSLLLEAELAKTRMESARTDRRVGGALLYDLRPRSRWSAQLLAGAGVAHVDVSDGMWQSKQEYGELGAGLSVNLTRRLQLAADLRVGARTQVDDTPTDLALKSMAPSADEEEKYTRGRVSAIFSF